MGLIFKFSQLFFLYHCKPKEVMEEILKELKELQKFVIKHKFHQERMRSDGFECDGGVFISAKGVESRINKLINKISETKK